MPPPLLSICIPTYNRSRRLDTLLHELAQQVSEPGMAERVEIIISDNASSDATQTVSEKWAAKHSFIHYFRNPWNIGGDPNQIRALGRGTAKYGWILGDDDNVREDAIARILTYLKPGVSQLFLDYRCVALDGKILAKERLRADIPDDITTNELIKCLGYVTVFSLISAHVFDREQLLAVDPLALLEVSPWYILCMALIVAFHDQKCVLVRDPVLDYTAGNDRLPDETALYVRVIGLLRTLKRLEEMGKIDSNFLFGVYETGAGNPWTLAHPHFFREELSVNLAEFVGFWALPGFEDWKLIRNFVDRGPGFWGIRFHLQKFFLENYQHYLRHRKPVIHFWRGKAWFPAFSILLSSDDRQECNAFDRLIAEWPEGFAHESILISRLPADDIDLPHVDVFMAPFQPHRAPSAALNSGFRKCLADRVLVLDQVCSPAMPEMIKKIDDWDARHDAPESCLIFESLGGEAGRPQGLLGLYMKRETFVLMGGFENRLESWSRHLLLADAGNRLGCEGWALHGGAVSRHGMRLWFDSELPLWRRLLRKVTDRPLVQHGLSISQRYHLQATRMEHQ